MYIYLTRQWSTALTAKVVADAKQKHIEAAKEWAQAVESGGYMIETMNQLECIRALYWNEWYTLNMHYRHQLKSVIAYWFIKAVLGERDQLKVIANAADVMCHEAFTLWSSIVDSDETSRDLKDRAWDYFKQTRDWRDTHRNNARYGKGINPYTLD